MNRMTDTTTADTIASTEPTIRRGTLAELTQDQDNANLGTQRGAALLEESLRRLGYGRSIVIDRKGRILAGNKTAEEAAALGATDIIIVQTDGHHLVAVQRTDLDLETDAAARELALADNRVGQVSLAFDPDAIARALTNGIDLGAYWTPEEIDAIMDAAPSAQPETRDADDAPTMGAVPAVTQPGDTWRLGKHRLHCGSPIDPDAVARLLEGRQYRMLWTAPPYEEHADAAASQQQITLMLLRAFAHGMPGASLYLASPSDRTLPAAIRAFTGTGWTYKHSLLWLMPQATITTGAGADYLTRHEVLLYGWKNDGGHYFTSGRTHDSVLEPEPPRRLDADPATRTVDLLTELIRNSSRRNEVVYAPHLTDGTAMIAAHRLGRVCYGIDPRPGWCDVVLARWEAETGKAPEVAR
jgi:hypothetical protein